MIMTLIFLGSKNELFLKKLETKNPVKMSSYRISSKELVLRNHSGVEHPSRSEIKKKIQSYKQQDKKAGRPYGGLTFEQVRDLLDECSICPDCGNSIRW